jgi:hypothetical protein
MKKKILRQHQKGSPISLDCQRYSALFPFKIVFNDFALIYPFYEYYFLIPENRGKLADDLSPLIQATIEKSWGNTPLIQAALEKSGEADAIKFGKGLKKYYSVSSWLLYEKIEVEKLPKSIHKFLMKQGLENHWCDSEQRAFAAACLVNQIFDFWLEGMEISFPKEPKEFKGKNFYKHYVKEGEKIHLAEVRAGRRLSGNQGADKADKNRPSIIKSNLIGFLLSLLKIESPKQKPFINYLLKIIPS